MLMYTKDLADIDLERYAISICRWPRPVSVGVRLLHRPSGLAVARDDAPTYWENRRAALDRLADLLVRDALVRLHRRLQPAKAIQTEGRSWCRRSRW